MSGKIKLLIFTEGGKNIGFGHITRCLALCGAFEERGVEPYFVIHGDQSVRGLLNGKKYQLSHWHGKQNNLIKSIKETDIVLVDSYLAKPLFYKKLNELKRKVIFIDDHNKIPYQRGIVINPALYAKSLGYPKKYSIKYLLGPKFALLRKEFWNLPSKRINNKVKKVLLTFGGEDIRNITPRILSLLAKCSPGLTKNVVIGRGFKNIKDIKSTAGKFSNLIYYPDAEIMKDIMLNSDMAICSGGQSLFELARIGVPTIAACLALNQYKNVISWEKAGCIEYAGWYNEKSLTARILSGIKKFKLKENRVRASRIGREIVDGKGPARVADFILKVLF